MSKNINIIFFDENKIKKKEIKIERPKNFNELFNSVNDNLSKITKLEHFNILYKKNETEEIKIDNDEGYKSYISSNGDLIVRIIKPEDTIFQKNNDEGKSASIKKETLLENKDNILNSSKTCINLQKKFEENNIKEKKIGDNTDIMNQKGNVIEENNDKTKQLEKKIEEKNNIIQKILNIFFKIYNEINSIGSIILPSDSNQKNDMDSLIKQISIDDINNVNNITEMISNNIFCEIEKFKQYTNNYLNKPNQSLMNEVNNDYKYKTEYTKNEKRGEKEKILSLLQSKTEFKQKKPKNLPYSCILRQDKNFQDISYDNLNQK